MPQLFRDLEDGLVRTGEIDAVITLVNIEKFFQQPDERVITRWQVRTEGAKLVDDEPEGRVPPAAKLDELKYYGEDPEQLKALQFRIRLAAAIDQDRLLFPLNFFPINAGFRRAEHCLEMGIEIKNKELVEIRIQEPAAVCLACGNVFLSEELDGLSSFSRISLDRFSEPASSQPGLRVAQEIKGNC